MARTTAAERHRAQQGGASAQPPHRRRSFGDVVRALSALLALGSLVAAVPVALLCCVGSPFPHHWDFGVLRQPITSETFVNTLAVLVWVAWAQFTACVLVEARAAASGVGIPARVPGSRPSQSLARQLVAALLLVGVGTAGLAPGLSRPDRHSMDGQVRPGAVVTARQTPGSHAAPQQAAARGPAGAATSTVRDGGRGARQATKFYRVNPPEGRHHDSLWEMARRHLGDGRRYQEIYELNKDRVQPDGSRLSQASLIRPGWVMEMPADAHGGDLVRMPVAAPHTAPDIRHYAEHGGARDTAAEGARTAERQLGSEHGGFGSGDGYVSGGGYGGVHPSGAVGAVGTGESATDRRATGLSDAPGFDPSDALVGAPLLAAGLLAALGRRRRTALWQSLAAGAMRDPRTPTGADADVADALRIGADQDAVDFLDRALRSLSARLAADSRSLPTVYAAWLTGESLDLQLAWPEGQPPAPWRTGQDEGFWRLERARLPEDVDTSAAAPYPGLAVLGTLNGARLLLNLESVPGIVSLTGAKADRDAVLGSVAAELATNGWSDRMTVTLVGFARDLAALAPARVRYVGTVAEAVEAMAAETVRRADALRTAGQGSVLTGRTQQATWETHVVLLAVEPTVAEAERLAELAADAGRLGIGYLVGTDRPDLPGAAWELEVTPAGRLLAPLLGLDLVAQLLPGEQYSAVLRLFADAGGAHARGGGRAGADLDGTDAGGGDPGPYTPPFLVDLSDRGRPGVYARLLGPYEVVGVDPPDPERAGPLYEALALLLLHREGVHPRVLAAALWPRGVTEDVRDALIARLRDWLGSDPDGGQRLTLDAAGRIVLSTSVVCDWDVLRTLHHEATEGRAASDPVARRRLLTDALSLARGRVLADRAAGRYGWLDHEIVDAQHPLLVAEIALALFALHLDAGKPKAALAAIEAAMAVSPQDDRLWLAYLRAADATGDPVRLRSAASALLARAGDATPVGPATPATPATPAGPAGPANDVGPAVPGPRLPPRVEALLDELLPSWRGGVTT